ncbi:hypothetical protein PAXRUDRAFT_185708 [Paxillus rubicundulus Ve08.2h10]|uniref:Unplaced genomic scaffold scaffold_1, whole genome shotgun sequence n=1 Tax=Paxillus rubicundulus Ve08.2h10 TaxID=930991 RepID=A0A0D0EB80_9AGAM|nr:hypothetical protein PAXRUDRAFT_185708 [Paxillus rubicundulus Ve08.2h10]
MSPEPIVALNNYLQSINLVAALSWRDSQSGPVHNPKWRSVCKISGREYGVGTGTHKHLARGAAATIALEAHRAEHGGG